MSSKQIRLPLQTGDTLEFSQDFGEVILRPIDGDDSPSIETSDSEMLNRFDVDIERDNSTVRVHLNPGGDSNWRHSFGRFRDFAIVLNLPIDVRARVHNATGQLRASGFRDATLDLHTDAGHIKIDHVHGRLRLATSAGQIRGDAVSGTIDATADAGQIKLDIDALDAGIHQFHTSAGAIRLVLAAGIDVAIDARSGIGSVRSEIPSTPNAAITIHASTDVGSVRIRRADIDDDVRSEPPVPPVPPVPPTPPVHAVPPSPQFGPGWAQKASPIVPERTTVEETPQRPNPENAVPERPSSAPPGRSADVLRILTLIERGTINAAEGAELLRAIGQ